MFGDFLENLQDSAGDAFSNWATNQIDGALGNSGFMTVGQEPTSNTTARQAMSGVKGQAPLQSSIQSRPENNVSQNGFGFGQVGSMLKDNMMLVSAGVMIVLAIILRGRR